MTKEPVPAYFKLTCAIILTVFSVSLSSCEKESDNENQVEAQQEEEVPTVPAYIASYRHSNGAAVFIFEENGTVRYGSDNNQVSGTHRLISEFQIDIDGIGSWDKGRFSADFSKLEMEFSSNTFFKE